MQIKNIVIDRGNSSFKIGVFEGRELLSEKEFEKKKEVEEFTRQVAPEYIMYSSVVGKNKDILKILSDYAKVLRLTHNTPLPFQNSYVTPETLGPDRIAAVAAAHDKFKNENCLVVDAGTCITYDFIDNNSIYHGGAISPGLKMRFKALHQFTSRLPLIEKSDNPMLVGNTTKTSIESGVINGTVAEMSETINQYKKNYRQLRVIICGGDSIFFESKLKGHIFAVANFVLIGLNRILLYNLKNFEGLY